MDHKATQKPVIKTLCLLVFTHASKFHSHENNNNTKKKKKGSTFSENC